MYINDRDAVIRREEPERVVASLNGAPVVPRNTSFMAWPVQPGVF